MQDQYHDDDACTDSRGIYADICESTCSSRDEKLMYLIGYRIRGAKYPRVQRNPPAFKPTIFHIHGKTHPQHRKLSKMSRFAHEQLHRRLIETCQRNDDFYEEVAFRTRNITRHGRMNEDEYQDSYSQDNMQSGICSISVSFILIAAQFLLNTVI